jgi:hypothetical protein
MLETRQSKYMDSPKAGIPDFVSPIDQGKKRRSTYTKLTTKAIKFVAPAFAIVGWLAMGLPSNATTRHVTATLYNLDVTNSYYNDYRVCAARLLRVNVPARDVAKACANALRPRDVSLCITQIQKHTQISATDALSSCTHVRLPRDFANCVVGISGYSKEAVNPAVLNYCGRSLLPVRFANCVVGLRAEIDVAAIQAMDTCIDASDQVSGFLPNFIPTPAGGSQLYLTPPTAPTNPVNPPGVSTPENLGGSNPGNLTPPVNPGSVTPVNPGNLAPQNQQRSR